MSARIWDCLLPSRYLRQLGLAEKARDNQKEALRRTIAKDQDVDDVVARLVADRRRNNYGPTIARALRRPA